MKKILLHDETSLLAVGADHWRDITDRYFDHALYDPSESYDPASTIICLPGAGAPEWCLRMYEQGYKTVIDNLWEPRWRWTVEQDYDRIDPSRVHTLQYDEYFWLEESLRILHDMDLGCQHFHDSQPTRTRLAWMPMRLRRQHRDRIWQALQPWLTDFYWSYIERGYFLPQDQYTPAGDCDQRFVNTLWIDDTWFTIAVETMVDEDELQHWGEHHSRMGYLGPWPFITEKTYKPIWMRHPFMVYGQSGILAKLQTLGFVTYDNIFDESYDSKLADKIAVLTKNVSQFDRTVGDFDSETRKRIDHNHDWFLRRDVVTQLAIENIFEPLMEYAEQT